MTAVVDPKPFIPQITLNLARQWCHFFKNVFQVYHRHLKDMYKDPFLRNPEVERLYFQSIPVVMWMEKLEAYLRSEKGIGASMTAVKYPFPKANVTVKHGVCVELWNWIHYYECWKRYLSLLGFSDVLDFHCELRDTLKKVLLTVPWHPVSASERIHWCVQNPDKMAACQLHHYFGYIFQSMHDKFCNVSRHLINRIFQIKQNRRDYRIVQYFSYDFKESFSKPVFMKHSRLGKKVFNLSTDFPSPIWELYKVCFEFLGWILYFEACFQATRCSTAIKTTLRKILMDLEKIKKIN